MVVVYERQWVELGWDNTKLDWEGLRVVEGEEV